MNKAWIVGVGPGDSEYVTVKAVKFLKEADYVAGFKQTLKVVENLVKGKMLPMDYTNEKRTLNLLASKADSGEKCVICCYGDPNFSDKQFLEKIKTVFQDVEVVPGISSVQISCAKAGLAMENSLFISFHKSGAIKNGQQELLKIVQEGHRNAVVLPKPWNFMPQDIAKFLIDHGVSPSREVMVHQNLTLTDETIQVTTLGELANTEHGDLSIIIIKPEESLYL